ncbi:unnamed protein product [Arabidopsis halleri]
MQEIAQVVEASLEDYEEAAKIRMQQVTAPKRGDIVRCIKIQT